MFKLNLKLNLKLKIIVIMAFIFSTVTTAGNAQAQGSSRETLNQTSNTIRRIDNYSTRNLRQITNVFQLRDVSPRDWAYEALRSLVERYGCIEGYPNRTFRGNRALSRYEFAAGLNACLEKIESLIAESQSIIRSDIQVLQRLTREFEAELAAIGARVDNLEGRVAFLEDNQFSTTTKLQGEVVFIPAQAFGEDVDSEVILANRVRLQFVSSFTGRDTLITRLTSGDIANAFQDELGTNEGRFAFDGQANNDVFMDRIHYYFPVGDNIRVFSMVSLGGHHFYADTFNTGLEAGGGASGAISRFAERNPIYRLNLGGPGVGFSANLGKMFTLYGGYLAVGASDPSTGAGLFNGNYSALGQLRFQPTDNFKIGFTYLNGFDTNDGPASLPFGATGTNLGNLNLSSIGFGAVEVSSNTYGIQGKFDVSPSFSIRAWGGFTDARIIGLGDAEIWNYAVIFAFPNLGKEGGFGALIFGAEPYLGGIEIVGDPQIDNETPFHIEVSYKYPVLDNISITPSVIVLTSPNQTEDTDTAVIGTIRTTFTF